MKAADRAAAESVIREATLLYPEGCDLVISAIAAAARHHRRPTGGVKDSGTIPDQTTPLI